jgi:hypothetical protein
MDRAEGKEAQEADPVGPAAGPTGSHGGDRRAPAIRKEQRRSIMTTEKVSRWRAALTLRLLDDKLREDTLAGIEKLAPQSPLMSIAAIAASYTALTTKGTKLTADVVTAAADEKVAKASAGVAAASRIAFDLELDTFKTLVENNATSAAELTSTGLPLLTQNATSRLPPDPPAQLLVRTGKAHGKARVVVAGKGYQGRFAAQVSVDPYGPTTWEYLPGAGKERKLSGYASGTKLWVRFAMVRFGMQSAWSTPVLITMP